MLLRYSNITARRANTIEFPDLKTNMVDRSVLRGKCFTGHQLCTNLDVKMNVRHKKHWLIVSLSRDLGI